jgi:large subunit ribosomal protein L21
LSAVIVAGGKQYRIAPGDQILVDRMAAEPGSTVKLGRVLLFNDGSEVKVAPDLDGVDVDAKVLAHRRGPRTEAIRYKSKKRVRVHHGGRSHLTALQIIAVGGVGLETAEPATEEQPPAKKARGAKAAPKKTSKAAPRAEAKVDAKTEAATEPAGETAAGEPKKPARRKKESE